PSRAACRSVSRRSPCCVPDDAQSLVSGGIAHNVAAGALAAAAPVSRSPRGNRPRLFRRRGQPQSTDGERAACDGACRRSAEQDSGSADTPRRLDLEPGADSAEGLVAAAGSVATGIGGALKTLFCHFNAGDAAGMRRDRDMMAARLERLLQAVGPRPDLDFGNAAVAIADIRQIHRRLQIAMLVKRGDDGFGDVFDDRGAARGPDDQLETTLVEYHR